MNLVLGVALLLTYRFGYGRGAWTGGAATTLQHGFPNGVELAPTALLVCGASQLYLGVLSLVPLPPLDGGRLLFAVCPQTLGWQKVQYQLVERNIGVAVLLALLIVPLGGPVPLLPQLLDSILAPVLTALTGG